MATEPAASVGYVDPSTGRTYALDEPRWCGDDGHYLSLTPGPGLSRDDIDPGRDSVWRYAKALLVGADDAVSMGEGFEFHLLAIGIALALILGGAGLWSVDASLAR